VNPAATTLRKDGEVRRWQGVGWIANERTSWRNIPGSTRGLLGVVGTLVGDYPSRGRTVHTRNRGAEDQGSFHPGCGRIRSRACGVPFDVEGMGPWHLPPAHVGPPSGPGAGEGARLEVAADTVQGIPLLAQRGVDGPPVGAAAPNRRRLTPARRANRGGPGNHGARSLPIHPGVADEERIVRGVVEPSLAELLEVVLAAGRLGDVRAVLPTLRTSTRTRDSESATTCRSVRAKPAAIRSAGEALKVVGHDPRHACGGRRTGQSRIRRIECRIGRHDGP
jgi:hypothetical protein